MACIAACREAAVLISSMTVSSALAARANVAASFNSATATGWRGLRAGSYTAPPLVDMAVIGDVSGDLPAFVYDLVGVWP